MVNVHYAKRIRNPFTTFFSNAETAPSSFRGNFKLLLHFSKRIRLSNLARHYYRNIIHVLDNSVLIFISVDFYFAIVFGYGNVC